MPKWRVNRDGIQWLADADGRVVGFKDNRGREYLVPSVASSSGASEAKDDPIEIGGLVSWAWNAATSGTWRPAAPGALPRFAVSGGASGGTWALSYRNAAGTVTSDPAETVAAGAVDVSPVFLDDATEIAVAITGTVTVEVK